MLTKNKAVEYTKIKHGLKRPQISVRFGDTKRFEQAEKQIEQAQEHPISIDEIINHTNDFLVALEMDKIICLPKEKPKSKEFYKNIKTEYNLEDKRDIVWMKFTKDNFLGVVAVSADINFNIPPSRCKKHYTETKNGKPKNKNNHWEYNTSGIIINHLGQKWKEDFVLIFPLKNIPSGLKRGHIECGIGNYLIDKGVPILDYYSHMF
ncbi:MAG: hypothetical protein FWD48_05870 [Oscillospiraceae bacterium]|nr:hypothetical protein [Oscillospiraceae bacterium]